MSECYKNVCPDVVGILVRVLQECCPGVARIINQQVYMHKNLVFPQKFMNSIQLQEVSVLVGIAKVITLTTVFIGLLEPVKIL